MNKLVPYHKLAQKHRRTSKVVKSWGVIVNSRARIQASKLSDGGYALCFRRRHEKGITSELKFALSPSGLLALLALILRGPADDAVKTKKNQEKTKKN